MMWASTRSKMRSVIGKGAYLILCLSRLWVERKVKREVGRFVIQRTWKREEKSSLMAHLSSASAAIVTRDPTVILSFLIEWEATGRRERKRVRERERAREEWRTKSLLSSLVLFYLVHLQWWHLPWSKLYLLVLYFELNSLECEEGEGRNSALALRLWR